MRRDKMVKYNLFFVPRLPERKRLSSLRREVCKEVHSTQALQYPVHMSLITSGFETKNYAAFEMELRSFCKKIKPFALKVEKNTIVLPERFWSGLQIIPNEELKNLQNKLQLLRNKHALRKEEGKFPPLHITLAFPAKVEGLKPTSSPVSTLPFDRITVVKKNNESDPYRVFKRISFS